MRAALSKGARKVVARQHRIRDEGLKRIHKRDMSEGAKKTRRQDGPAWQIFLRSAGLRQRERPVDPE